MAQQIKALAAMPEELSLITETYLVEAILSTLKLWHVCTTTTILKT